MKSNSRLKLIKSMLKSLLKIKQIWAQHFFRIRKSSLVHNKSNKPIEKLFKILKSILKSKIFAQNNKDNLLKTNRIRMSDPNLKKLKNKSLTAIK